LKPSLRPDAKVAKEFKKLIVELTAAGTAPDFHRIPYSPVSVNTDLGTKLMTKVSIF